MRSIGVTKSWESVKVELTKHYSPKETYHQLYHEAFNLKNLNVRQYYYNLSAILNKLNEKFEFDDTNPSEFKPEVNEKLILRTFKSNIDPYLASIIVSRSITSLREAFDLFECEGLLNSKPKSEYNNKNAGTQSRFNQKYNSNSSENKNITSFNQNHRNSGRFNQNNRNLGSFNQNNRNAGGFNPNFRNSGMFNSNRRNPVFFNQNQNNNQNPFRQNNNYTQQRSQEPMDVDHLQQEVNFLSLPLKHIYR